MLSAQTDLKIKTALVSGRFRLPPGPQEWTSPLLTRAGHLHKGWFSSWPPDSPWGTPLGPGGSWSHCRVQHPGSVSAGVVAASCLLVGTVLLFFREETSWGWWEPRSGVSARAGNVQVPQILAALGATIPPWPSRGTSP